MRNINQLIHKKPIMTPFKSLISEMLDKPMPKPHKIHLNMT